MFVRKTFKSQSQFFFSQQFFKKSFDPFFWNGGSGANFTRWDRFDSFSFIGKFEFYKSIWFLKVIDFYVSHFTSLHYLSVTIQVGIIDENKLKWNSSFPEINSKWPIFCTMPTIKLYSMKHNIIHTSAYWDTYSSHWQCFARENNKCLPARI